MQGICGVFNSSIAADWVGAVGSAGAAIVAVGVYLVDRRSARRLAAERLADSRRRQALHVAVLLDEMWAQLHVLKRVAATNEARSIDALLLPSASRILDALVDVAAFDADELESMYSFSSVVSHLNHMLEHSAIQDGARRVFNLPAAERPFIDRCLEACDTLRKDLWRAGGAVRYANQAVKGA